ncbi:MAG: hypothetical protein ACTSX8_01555, partial [Alphaproteobacteria bacterium]
NVSQARKQGFTAEAYRDTSVTMEFVDHNQVAHMDGQLQIDHDWDLDTPIHVHVHVIPMTGVTGNVYWEYSYYFAPIDGVIPADASWTSGNIATPLAGADQYKHKVVEIFTFTPSGGTPSSILMFRISRDSTDILDTYDTAKDHGTAVSNLGILYIDAHYTKSKPGTLTEYA